MWNWQSNRQSEFNPKQSLAGSPFKPSFASTPQARFVPSEFNLRSHYQQLKQNHPYYQQLHKPHQTAVKFSYLEATKSFIEESSVLSSSNHRTSQKITHIITSKFYVYKNRERLKAQNLLSNTNKYQKKQSKMCDFENEKKIFEKGTYVFGRCQDELPWPARIARVLKSKFYVNFINHRSSATLTQDCLTIFSERSCLQVMEEYNKSGKNSDKVLAAIRSCRNEIASLIKREQRQQLKIKKSAKDQTKNDQKSKQDKQANKNLRKVMLKTPFYAKSEQVIKQQEVVMPSEDKIQKGLMMNILISDVNSQADKVGQISNNSSLEKVQQSVQPSRPLQETPIPSVSYVSSIADQSISVLPECNHQPSVLDTSQVSMVVEEDSKPNQTDAEEEQAQKRIINSIIFFLKKMISYLTGNTSNPLTKDEKMEFALLLENHRKFYYDHGLLEAMIDFLKAFDFKQKEERKNCIIEYIKIKERMETACFLRCQLCYDQKTQQILEKYAPRSEN